MIDLAVNTLTILLQLFIAGRITQRYGVATTLALVPALLAVGFVFLAVAPVLPVLIATQVARRAGNYAITKPSREVLFTVVPRSQKYKAKNFIDTVVYRGGDAIAGWVFAGMKMIGLSLSTIAWIAVPLSILWFALGLHLGKQQQLLANTVKSENKDE